jgi:tetratricopeptide (TPR) repeat protein
MRKATNNPHASDDLPGTARRAATLELVQAANALTAGDLALAEQLCRNVLKRDRRNVAAMRLLGDVGVQFGRFEEAEVLFTLCLELAPGFQLARHSYADLLFRTLRYREALAEVDTILAAEPEHSSALLLKASILAMVGSLDEAIRIYETLVDKLPGQPRVHLSLAHALKTIGRQSEALAEYRRALELEPDLGETYWSLSNLKTFRFADADVTRMRAQADDPATSDENRLHWSFALGKALEDRGEYDESFRHYASGNALRRRTVRWDSDGHHEAIERLIAFYRPEFFAARQGFGNPSSTPIFVVGLPRAGSTLLEQILSSHSQVEGTMELPDLMSLVQRLNRQTIDGRTPGYPDGLASLTAADFEALGAEYLDRTAVYRDGAPRFIDKMPNNYGYVGLIHLMLPNATILDARRQPMACGFSVFKQLFAHGQNFSYSLEEIGRYYRDYVLLMSHWDAVLPSRVLRVDYEKIVADTDAEVRRVLDHCGLEFEPGCLEFHRTERAVRTPSSEQVRQPIFRDGLEQWRHYAAHLAPLRDALGPMPSDAG